MNIKPASPDRCHIDGKDPQALRFWSKHFDVTEEALLSAIDKVGNHVPTVRKELGLNE